MEKKRKVRFDDPQAGKIKKAKGERTLTLDGKNWFWKTDGYHVYIRSPQNKRVAISANQLLGGDRKVHDWNELVTPFDIKEYINTHMAEFA